jgi:hypothetical protein
VKSGLAQFDLNDDPGFEKIVVSVMPDPMDDLTELLEGLTEKFEMRF